jgi:hypothetical protein
MSADDVAAVVRGLMDEARQRGEQAGVLGVPPKAAASFPNDARIYVSPVEPMSFSLPAAPTGLVMHMDERGNGHLWALGENRVSLGSDGMWWIVDTLIDALSEPGAASIWPRIMTLGTTATGSATQASLRWSEWAQAQARRGRRDPRRSEARVRSSRVLAQAADADPGRPREAACPSPAPSPGSHGGEVGPLSGALGLIARRSDGALRRCRVRCSLTDF